MWNRKLIVLSVFIIKQEEWKQNTWKAQESQVPGKCRPHGAQYSTLGMHVQSNPSTVQTNQPERRQQEGTLR